MDGGAKKSGSSLASDLFGAKDPSSSSGSFGSIFAPPPKGLGGVEIGNSAETKNKNGSGNPTWNANNGVSDKNASGGADQSRRTTTPDVSSYYQEQKPHPFHYSSSIYYGGQDVYTQPQDPQNPGLNTIGKDGGEDNAGTASIGDWWQGSFYY